MTYEYIRVTYKWHVNEIRITEDILIRKKVLELLERIFKLTVVKALF